MNLEKLATDSTLEFIAHEFVALKKSMDMTWYGDSIVDNEEAISKKLHDTYSIISKYQKDIFPIVLRKYDQIAASIIVRLKYATGDNHISRNTLPKALREYSNQFNPDELDFILKITDNIVPNNTFMMRMSEHIEKSLASLTLLNEYENVISKYNGLFKKAHKKIALELRDKDRKVNLKRAEIVELQDIERLWSMRTDMIWSNLRDVKGMKASIEALQSNQTLQQQDKLRLDWIKRNLDRLQNLRQAVRDYIKSGSDEKAFFHAIKKSNDGIGYGFKNAESKIGSWVRDIVSYLPTSLRNKYMSEVEHSGIDESPLNSTVSGIPILQENKLLSKDKMPAFYQQFFDEEENDNATEPVSSFDHDKTDNDKPSNNDSSESTVTEEKSDKPKGLFDKIKSWFKRSNDQDILESFVKTAELIKRIDG